MKKFIYSAIAAIGLLLSPSCSDENEALSGSGNEALVSFSVNLADGIQTKADPEPVIGDGTTAKQLFVRVFEDNNGSVGNEITGLAKNNEVMGADLRKEVNFVLVKGKTYHFLFWAQAYESNETASPFSFDGHTVKVSYEGAVANDEKRDAFYAVKTKTVTGSFQEEVTLYRPFAQLNFLTTAEDIKAAINAGQRVEKTSITVASAAKALTPDSSFDPDEKPSVSDAAENVLFNFAKVPFTVSDDNTVSSSSSLWIENNAVVDPETTDATQYFYLATTYFLVNNTEDATAQIVLANVNMKVEGAEGDGLSVQSVPVRMNYRTNIYGNLLTATGKFNVMIDKNFVTPEHNIEITEREVDSEAAAAEAFAEGASKVTLTEELPQVSESSGIIPQTYARENTEVIELVLEKPITPGYVFTYKENTGSGTNTFAPATVHITIPEGSTTINESNIQLPQSTVYVNGVKVTTMTAETYSHTLVVGPGTEIGTLNVKQGHVRIMNGGQVGTIVNQTANPRVDVIVDLEEGGTLENIPDVSTTKIIVRRSISTAEGLKDFAAEVNSGKTYAGQTVVLSADIDLNGVKWTPIGPNADASNKFQGTFDGQGHTIRNLKVNQEADYHAAGLFGALNGIAKDFTIDGATITSISQGNDEGDTDNGTAVVAGSIYNTGSIENVTVKNATVNGNRYVAGIAGYVYGSIKDCTVENSTITSTPDKLIGKYDNGDKAGGIVGYICGEPKSLVKGCSVKNLTVTAYRDVAGIAGCARETVEIENNSVDKVTVIANMLQDGGGKTLADANAGEVVGRNLANANLSTNTTNNVTVTIYGIDKDKDVATVGTNDGITYAINKGITTIHLTPGTYIIHADAKDKELTFIGTDDPNDVTVDVVGIGGENCDYGLDSSTVTFKGITITTNSSTYIGYARCKGTYKNCVINGTYTLYGESKFENCTFNVSGDVYNIWTWGAQKIEFDGCTFNSDGKALLLFQEGANTVNLTVKKCIFNDKGGLTDKKAAIEIGDASYGAKPIYNVTVSETTVNGYEINDKGINTGTTLWGNKNSMPTDRLHVIVDGVKKY